MEDQIVKVATCTPWIAVTSTLLVSCVNYGLISWLIWAIMELMPFLGYCTGNQAYYGCCTSSHKCNENEGHCKNDEECQDGLRCGFKNCPNSSLNCCYNHTVRK